MKLSQGVYGGGLREESKENRKPFSSPFLHAWQQDFTTVESCERVCKGPSLSAFGDAYFVDLLEELKTAMTARTNLS